MVSTTQVLCKYIPEWYLLQNSGGAFFKKQSCFFMTRYLGHRVWNCYKHAQSRYYYFLKGEAFFAKHKRGIRRDIVRSRIAAACEEHGFKYSYLISTLPKIDINLNLHALSNLAIYEPQTFKSLVDIAKRAGVGEHDPFGLTTPNRGQTLR